MKNISQLITFVKFTHKFHQIQRIIYATGEDRNENDAEHSFQLALVGWYLIQKDNLALDIDLVIKYSLVHDLVEIYAGDTYCYTTNKEDISSKASREKFAAEKIKHEFPEFPELHALIEEYEKKADQESRFVYALDKIISILNIYIDKGRSWKRENVTLEMLVNNKAKKVEFDQDIKEYFNIIVAMLQEEELALFKERL